MTAASEASGYDSLADIYDGHWSFFAKHIPGTAEHRLGETGTRMTKTVVMCRAFTESRIEVHMMGTRLVSPFISYTAPQ